MPEMQMVTNNRKNEPLPYSIIARASTDGTSEAEVNLYGEVVESVPTDWWTGEKIDGLYIELAQFLNDIDTYKDFDRITFRINSVGGDVHAGIAIYNRIRELAGETTTIVDGLAASAASVIAQAGDHRIVQLGSQTMIHGCSTVMLGYYNADALKKALNAVNAIDESLATIYAERSGLDVDSVTRMLKAEKWLTADEAVEKGLADEIQGKEAPKAESTKDASILIVNGIPHNMRGLPLPSMRITRARAKVSHGAGPSDINKNPSKKGEQAMDLQELKNQYPDLVKQIQNEALQTAQADREAAVRDAVEAERKRIEEIDSIQASVGEELAHAAKYTDIVSAPELAMKALQAQAAAGQSFAQARSQEVTDSGASSVTPDPVCGSEEEQKRKDIADGAAMIAGI